MNDPTESIRRVEQAIINALPDEGIPEPHWTTEQLRDEFEVLGFLAPYVVARRKSDGKVGSLEFRHSPRVYFNFVED